MANKGNAFAHGKGVVRIPDTNTDFSFDMDTFVPGTAIVFPMLWTKSVVPGKHQVEVDIDYEGGRRTTWNGVVTIEGSGKGDLEAALRNVQAPALLGRLQLAAAPGGGPPPRLRGRGDRHAPTGPPARRFQVPVDLTDESAGARCAVHRAPKDTL